MCPALLVTDISQNKKEKIPPELMPTTSPYSHGVKRTGPVHLHSCRLHVCLFCFSLKVHRPPLESYESHAAGGAAELKVCHRGEAPVAGLKSPIATQSPRQEGPAQEQRRAGEGQCCVLETHWPSTRCLDRYGFAQGCVSLLRSWQGLGWQQCDVLLEFDFTSKNWLIHSLWPTY